MEIPFAHEFFDNHLLLWVNKTEADSKLIDIIGSYYKKKKIKVGIMVSGDKEINPIVENLVLQNINK